MRFAPSSRLYSVCRCRCAKAIGSSFPGYSNSIVASIGRTTLSAICVSKEI